MRRGDTMEQHRAKLEAKRQQLIGKGWSAARTDQYLKDWGMFSATTYTSRKRANEK